MEHTTHTQLRNGHRLADQLGQCSDTAVHLTDGCLLHVLLIQSTATSRGYSDWHPITTVDFGRFHGLQ